MRAHFRIARTNGLSEDELAEVIYHASGYAGFPRAVAARTAARAALAE
jgi:4-carboxymuconolactone decarboxylase